MTDITQLNQQALSELSYFMLGKKLGDGSARDTYELLLDPTKVIKLECKTQSFQNIMEWENWLNYRDKKEVSKWLAPCHYISHSGTFLIMDKVESLREHEIPKKLPEFLTDHKLDNFGMLNGRVVCRDYGYLNLSAETKFRKWRSYETPFRE